MANLNGADINLTFGVEGGASTATGSGKIMYDQIRAIVSDIEQKVSLGLKISPDAITAIQNQVSKAFTINQITVTETAAANLRTQIQSILDSGNFTINVTGNVNGSGQGNGSGGSGNNSGGSGGSGNNSGSNTNQNNSGVYLGGSLTRDAAGNLRRWTDAYKELNGQIRSVNSSINNENQVVQLTTISTRELATEAQNLTTKYDNLARKASALKNSGTDIMQVNELNMMSRGFDKIKSRVNNVYQALQESLLNPEDSQKIYKRYSRRVGMSYSNTAGNVNVDSDIKAIEALKYYIQEAQAEYEKMRSSINAATRDTNNLAQTTHKITGIKDSFSKLAQTNSNKSSYNNIRTQVKEIDKLNDAIKRYNSLTSVKAKQQFNWQTATGNQNIERYDQALAHLNRTLANTASAIRTVQKHSSLISYKDAIIQAEQFAKVYERFKDTPGAENTKLFSNSRLAQTFEDYKTLMNTDSKMSERVRALRNLVTGYDNTARSMKALTSATRILRADSQNLARQQRESINSQTQINKIYQEADNYYKKYRSSIQSNVKINKQWLELMNQLKSGKFDGDELGARNALASLQTATKQANAEVRTLWGSIKKLFTDHFGAVTATMAIGMIRNLLRTSYQYVLDIDKAMTELRKVTELTEAQYEAFGNTAARIAKEVGGSVADTISATADFARLGFEFDESQSLAKAALVYKNVGDGIEDISEASESIISTIKAFSDIDANDAMSIIDKFNEVGNNFAISSSGLGVSMQKSAAALASANNTIDESIAMITAANSVVQNPEVVGTTMKTISMYLRASKTEAEEAGIATDGMVTSVSKLRDEIKSLSGVDIMFDDENYKSTYQILKEISEVWENISDVSQANILEKLGGKRNANVVASIIENFDVAEEALATSLDSAGSAVKENEKWLESIQGHLNQLKVTFEEFSQTIMESDFIKGAIDFLTEIVSALNNITKGLGGLTPIVLSLLANGFFNHNRWGFGTVLSDGSRGLSLFGSSLGQIGKIFQEYQNNVNAAAGSTKRFLSVWNGMKSVGKFTSSAFANRLSERFGFVTKEQVNANLKLVNDYYEGLEAIKGKAGSNRLTNKVTAYQNNWLTSTAGQSASQEVRDMTKELDRLKIKGEDATKTLNQFRETQQSLGKTSSALASIFSGLGSMALDLGISLALNLAIQGIMSAIRKGQEQLEQAQKAAEKFQETYGSIDKTIQNVIKLQAELDNANTTESRAKTIKEDLVSIQKELNETYKDEAGYIDLTTHSIEEYIDAIRRKNAEEYANVDYYKQSGGIISTLSQFNNAGLNLDMRAFNRASVIEYYERLGEGAANVRDTLINIWKDLGFTESYSSGQSKTLVSFKYNGDIFTADQKLLESQKKIEEYINDDTLTDSVRAHYQQAFNYIAEVRSQYVDKILESQATFEAYIINGDFKEDKSGYSDIYNKLIKDQANYQYKISKAKTQKEVDQIRKEYDAAITEAFASIDGEKDPAVLQWFKTKFEVPETEVKRTTEKIKSRIRTAYDEIQAAIADLESGYETAFKSNSDFQSTYNKIISGASLTADEVLKLVEICEESFPEISTLFEETVDGYTINAEQLRKANKAILEGIRKDIQDEINNAKSLLELDTQTREAPVPSMPSSEYSGWIGQNKNQLLSDDDKQSLRNQINVWELYLNLLDDAAEKHLDLSEAVKNLSSSISTGTSAQKEMNESGHISLSTYSSILSLGEEYNKCLTIENGIIKFNAEEYKKLSKAKLIDELSTIALTRAELNLRAAHEAQYNHSIPEEIQSALREASERENQIKTSLKAFEEDWNKALTDTGKSTDTVKEAFESAMKDIEHLHNMGLKSDAEYYDALEAANEDYYANSADHESEYLSNIEKIYNGRFQIYKKEADKEFEELENNYKRGFYTAEEYAQKYNELAESKYGEGSLFFGSTLASDELDSLKKQSEELINSVYDERLEALTNANNKTLSAERTFVSKWIVLNKSVYQTANPKKYKENIKEIAKYISDVNKLIDDDLKKWKIDNSFDSNNTSSRQSYLDYWISETDTYAKTLHQVALEYDNIANSADNANKSLMSIEELTAGTNDLNEQRKAQAKEQAEIYKQEYENGKYDYDTFKSNVNSIRDNEKFKGVNGENLLDETFFSDILKAQDEYDAFVENTTKKYSSSVDDQKAFLGDIYSKLTELDSGFTQKERETNWKDYADRYVEWIREQIDKGLIDIADGQLMIQAMFVDVNAKGANLGKDWLSDALNIDGYEQDLRKLQKLNDGTLKSEQQFLNSWKGLIYNTYGDKTSMSYNLTEYESKMQEYADQYVEWIKDQISKGIVDVETGKAMIEDLFKDVGAMGINLGEDWLAKALEIDSYEDDLQKLQSNNDKTLTSERKFISKWRELIGKTYGDESSPFYNLTEYKSKVREATEYELTVLEKAFKRGEISAAEYTNAVKQALENRELLGADFVAEMLKNSDKTLAEQEKTYWEQQKQNVSDYYDTEIEKLQKIKDEHDKIAKAEELQLKLIQARLDLENAMRQKSQLIFKDGTFYYDYNQEDVLSKQQALNEAEEAVYEGQIDDAISELQSQKDNALTFYTDLIEIIEAYINETVQIEGSNSEILNKILNSEYSQEMKDIQAGKGYIGDITDEAKAVVGTSSEDISKADKAVEKAQSGVTEEKNIFGKWKDYLIKPIVELFSQAKALIENNPEIASTLSLGIASSNAANTLPNQNLNAYTNSNVSNDNSVNVGDITVTVQGGTSQEMLEQFANQLSSVIISSTSRAVVSS